MGIERKIPGNCSGVLCWLGIGVFEEPEKREKRLQVYCSLSLLAEFPTLLRLLLVVIFKWGRAFRLEFFCRSLYQSPCLSIWFFIRFPKRLCDSDYCESFFQITADSARNYNEGVKSAIARFRNGRSSSKPTTSRGLRIMSAPHPPSSPNAGPSEPVEPPWNPGGRNLSYINRTGRRKLGVVGVLLSKSPRPCSRRLPPFSERI